MRCPPPISQIGVLLLSGCSLLEPKSTFEIESADRPVKSATLKLCRQTFSMANVGERWVVSIHVPGDCDGGVSAVMSDGKNVFCLVDYVTGGDGSERLFNIKNDVCQSTITYGESRVSGR